MRQEINKVMSLLTVADGGSLLSLEKKGNLSHVETLYNPDNFFSEVHILVFNKADLAVKLFNPTLKVHYLSHLPWGKLGLLLSLPWLVIQSILIIRRYKIQIIRARNAYLAGMIGVLSGKWAGIPTVISLGGDNRLAQSLIGHYYGGNRFLSFFLEEFSLQRANRIFCVNEFTRQYALRLGASAAQTVIVPHRLDIDLEKNAPTKHEIHTKVNENPTILIIGRLERDKQVEVVVETIPLVYKTIPHAKFIFIGDGSLRAQLQSRIEALQITQAAQFVGFKSRQEISSYLATASIVCIPMSGFVMYEAAAAKKPIVAFDVEWHSEFIKNGETGLLVKNRDIDCLAKAIVALLSDSEEARRLGQNAYNNLRDQFDRQAIINKEITAYKELLA